MSYHKSNCLLEAIKAYVKSKGKVEIHMIGDWNWIITRGCFPHFYWVDANGVKHRFDARYSDEPLYGQLWYEGSVKSYAKE